jgi:hypothetical protein
MSAACSFDPSGHAWRLSNDRLEIHLAAGPGGLELAHARRLPDGHAWRGANGASWPWLQLGGIPLAELRFVDWRIEDAAGGLRLEVTFQPAGRADISLVAALWLSGDLPLCRQWCELTNHGAPLRVENCLLIDLALDHDLAGAPLELFSVDAFAGHRRDRWEPGDKNFACRTERLDAGGAARYAMGAYQERCSWLAARLPGGEGLFLGLEYGGAAELRAYDIQRTAVGAVWASTRPLGPGLRLAAQPAAEINVPVETGESWRSPAAFWGTFSGDWDEAAHLTHQTVEGCLAPPHPGEHFPPAALNTWGYAFDLTPADAWRCLEIAAEIGAEEFDADYGWFERVGDWTPVERNFPPLAELSARVHQRGLKFGLWMSFANADPASAVAREHPEWLCAPDPWGSFRTRALCLGNADTRAWVTAQVLAVVRSYGVDHLKFDFEVITPCTHPGHSHPPDPAGYHSLQGFNQVLRALRAEFPGLVIESCAGGGRLMTYETVQLADTSITSDGGVLRDPLARRSALYGASYPFPLRYCDNYMEEPPSDLACHSSMIGGPWILMDRADRWTAEQTACATRNIRLYKRIRPLFHGGYVHHLRPPDGIHADALQVQHPGGKGLLFLFQPLQARPGPVQVCLKGLDPLRDYRLTSSRGVSAGRGDEVGRASGARWMESGLTRSLMPGESEIIEIEPLQP